MTGLELTNAFRVAPFYTENHQRGREMDREREGPHYSITG